MDSPFDIAEGEMVVVGDRYLVQARSVVVLIAAVG
jgi:hypothetical protein